MADGPLVGSVLDLDVGTPASGGSFIARTEGRVVFVRHALPGERVRAVITEDRAGSYLRADAVEVLRAHDQRVVPPCPYAGPGRCGGCDWQHASAALQLEMKADIVREQFRRLAAMDVGDVFDGISALPGGLLGWRTRVTYAVGADARLGLHKHRSTDVQRVDRCLLGVHGVGDADVLAQARPGVSAIEVVRGADGALTVLEHRPGPGRQARGRRPPDRVRVESGPAEVAVDVAGEPMHVAAGGFWQVHPAAVDVYGAAVLELLRPAPGERVLELFSGSGALTAVLADAVGAAGAVLAVESSAAAVADAQRNLATRPQVRVRRARIDAELLGALDAEHDVVLLDPPRAGLGAAATSRLLDLRPRAVAYLSCDPASLARDVRAAAEAGWRLATLRGYDAFPMTAHVECLALLVAA